MPGVGTAVAVVGIEPTAERPIPISVEVKHMKTVEKAIEVDVPVTTAYNQPPPATAPLH